MLRRFILSIFIVFPLYAGAEEFVAGRDYEIITSTAESAGNNTKIAVMEFFSYGCPWCFRIESALLTWVAAQGDKIQFSKVPVVFHQDWIFYAKAYYTAKRLGLEAKLTPILFQALQSKNKQTLNSNQDMINFFISQGVDAATAKSAFENSTLIDMEVKQGLVLMSRFQIKGVPALVVNNRFKTNLEMAKDQNRLFKILEFLVAKAAHTETK